MICLVLRGKRKVYGLMGNQTHLTRTSIPTLNPLGHRAGYTTGHCAGLIILFDVFNLAVAGSNPKRNSKPILQKILEFIIKKTP